jgi:hypothetical protein
VEGVGVVGVGVSGVSVAVAGLGVRVSVTGPPSALPAGVDVVAGADEVLAVEVGAGVGVAASDPGEAQPVTVTSAMALPSGLRTHQSPPPVPPVPLSTAPTAAAPSTVRADTAVTVDGSCPDRCSGRTRTRVALAVSSLYSDQGSTSKASGPDVVATA